MHIELAKNLSSLKFNRLTWKLQSNFWRHMTVLPQNMTFKERRITDMNWRRPPTLFSSFRSFISPTLLSLPPIVVRELLSLPSLLPSLSLALWRWHYKCIFFAQYKLYIMEIFEHQFPLKAWWQPCIYNIILLHEKFTFLDIFFPHRWRGSLLSVWQLSPCPTRSLTHYIWHVILHF